jgi:uncharacterized protein (UPF0332 family)
MKDNNEIEKEYAIILREEQDDRILADYNVTFLAEEDRVEERISAAKIFFDRMILYLESHQLSVE